MKRSILTILMLGILAGPAYAIGPMTFHTFGHQAGSSWDSWDEKEQGGLATDQDGDGTDDTFVCMFDNPTANGNDTGSGVTAAADLVLTQNGNIVGAVASPPYRAIDGGNDYFLTANGLWNATIAGVSNTWTFIMKIYVDSSDMVNQEIMTGVGGGLADATMNIWFAGGGKNMRFRLDDLDHVADEQATTNNGFEDRAGYIVIFCDGLKTMAGFSVGRPSKLSDLAANDRVLFANNYNSFKTGLGLQIGGRGSFIKGRLYYVIFSKKCLIDTGR
jgi:hypothetical protein